MSTIIYFTVRAFQNLIFNWMENIHDCYILDSKTIHDPFVPSKPLFLLAGVYNIKKIKMFGT